MRTSLIVIISISFLMVSGGWGAASGVDSIRVPTLKEWASSQPRQFAPDGREIPFSATLYFRQYHPDSVLAAGGGREGSRWEPILRSTGDHCCIYVDSAASPQPNNTCLINLTNEFDDHIWPVDTGVFGSCGYASIDIFIYPIDGPGSVGGFYQGGNDLYIDNYDMSWVDEILTHEFQHCIHNTRDSGEQEWVNEGCADLAIQLCYGFFNNTTSLSSHMAAFEARPDNDLTVFQSQLSDYGSSYAFLSYFHEHFGGNATITALVADKARGTAGFNNRLAGTGKNFTSVFRDWTVANYLNNRSIGPAYGYSNLSLKLSAARVSVYPSAFDSSVQRWAADYYNFTAEGADLELDFNGSDSTPLEVWLGAIGKGQVPSFVRKMPLDDAKDGNATVPCVGLYYSEVVMVVSASTAGGNYSFRAKAVDRTPPLTELNLTPPRPQTSDGWYTGPPNITLTTNEPRCASFYRWDDGPFKLYSGPLAAMEGRHSFGFWSRDAAGNAEPKRSVFIKVDTTPPLTVLLVQPPAPDGLSGWFTVNPSIDLSTEVGAATYYSWDLGPEANFTDAMTSEEGTHTLHYRSVDVHGNREVSRSAVFKVDTLAPSSARFVYPSAPDGLDGWYLRTPTIRLDTEPGAEIYYFWNSEPPTKYQLPFPGREGQNRLTYYSMDQAGNAEAPKELEINVDTVPPTCEARLEPPAPDGWNDYYRIQLSITLASEPDAALFYRWDFGKWSNCTGPLLAPDGYHTLSYYAVDQAGNRGPEESLELRVDLALPVTVLSVDPELGDVWYIEAPAVKLATSPDAAAYYSIDGGPPREANGRIGLFSGIHQLCYWAVDGAGNEEARRCREFRVDLDDPAAQLTLPAPYAIEGVATAFDGSGSRDGDSGIRAYRFIFGDGGESGWTSSPVAYHVYSRAGIYRTSLTVRDAAGRESQQSEQSMTVNALQAVPGGPPEPPSGTAALSMAAGMLAAAGLALAVAMVSIWGGMRRKKAGAGLPKGGTSAAGALREGAGPAEDNLKMPEELANAREGKP